ncbi:MAG: hypothetical protein KVP17_001056 [Porospora cf. gigantea B]|uniref:uncharacterized protein n=1 Tax=Porospora cf. gigantea B TaxID=2853592 RepID=UPI003571AB02|nr:MAG: hypothetical protein KVP17_001056 [Porospora cf. gigantea B]
MKLPPLDVATRAVFFYTDLRLDREAKLPESGAVVVLFHSFLVIEFPGVYLGGFALCADPEKSENRINHFENHLSFQVGRGGCVDVPVMQCLSVDDGTPAAVSLTECQEFHTLARWIGHAQPRAPPETPAAIPADDDCADCTICIGRGLLEQFPQIAADTRRLSAALATRVPDISPEEANDFVYESICMGHCLQNRPEVLGYATPYPVEVMSLNIQLNLPTLAPIFENEDLKYMMCFRYCHPDRMSAHEAQYLAMRVHTRWNENEDYRWSCLIMLTLATIGVPPRWPYIVRVILNLAEGARPVLAALDEVRAMPMTAFKFWGVNFMWTLHSLVDRIRLSALRTEHSVVKSDLLRLLKLLEDQLARFDSYYRSRCGSTITQWRYATRSLDDSTPAPCDRDDDGYLSDISANRRRGEFVAGSSCVLTPLLESVVVIPHTMHRWHIQQLAVPSETWRNHRAVGPKIGRKTRHEVKLTIRATAHVNLEPGWSFMDERTDSIWLRNRNRLYTLRRLRVDGVLIGGADGLVDAYRGDRFAFRQQRLRDQIQMAADEVRRLRERKEREELREEKLLVIQRACVDKWAEIAVQAARRAQQKTIAREATEKVTQIQENQRLKKEALEKKKAEEASVRIAQSIDARTKSVTNRVAKQTRLKTDGELSSVKRSSLDLLRDLSKAVNEERQQRYSLTVARSMDHSPTKPKRAASAVDELAEYRARAQQEATFNEHFPISFSDFTPSSIIPDEPVLDDSQHDDDVSHLFMRFGPPDLDRDTSFSSALSPLQMLSVSPSEFLETPRTSEDRATSGHLTAAAPPLHVHPLAADRTESMAVSWSDLDMHPAPPTREDLDNVESSLCQLPEPATEGTSSDFYAALTETLDLWPSDPSYPAWDWNGAFVRRVEAWPKNHVRHRSLRLGRPTVQDVASDVELVQLETRYVLEPMQVALEAMNCTLVSLRSRVEAFGWESRHRRSVNRIRQSLVSHLPMLVLGYGILSRAFLDTLQIVVTQIRSHAESQDILRMQLDQMISGIELYFAHRPRWRTPPMDNLHAMKRDALHDWTNQGSVLLEWAEQPFHSHAARGPAWDAVIQPVMRLLRLAMNLTSRAILVNRGRYLRSTLTTMAHGLRSTFDIIKTTVVWRARDADAHIPRQSFHTACAFVKVVSGLQHDVRVMASALHRLTIYDRDADNKVFDLQLMAKEATSIPADRQSCPKPQSAHLTHLQQSH